MAAVNRVQLETQIGSNAENSVAFDGLWSGVEPKKGEDILKRASKFFEDMRKNLTPKTQSRRGWVGSFANPLVKACFRIVGPSETRTGFTLRAVRSALNTLAPIFVPKPVGVVSEPFSYKTVKSKYPKRVAYVGIKDKGPHHFRSNSVTGEWVRPSCYDPARPTSERKVVIYLPGGAYHVGSHHTHGAITGRIARDAHCEVCVVDYPLLPEHAYPEQINAVLTVYNQLLSQGYTAENIMFAGDSAGGHLATVVVHHIQKEIKEGRFNTASGLACNGLVLISPVANFNLEQYQGPFDPLLPCEPISPTARNLHRQVSEHLTASTSNLLDHPTVSPVNINLEELGGVHPPAFFSYGKDEILGKGAKEFHDTLLAAGVPVLEDVGEIIHTGHIASAYLPEAAAMMKDLTDYIGFSLETDTQREEDITWAVKEGGYMNVEGFPL